MQSIPALRLLPVVACAVSCIAVPLSAQAGARVTNQGEWFYQTAAGRRLAQLEAGSVVQTGAVQNGWTNVTLDGWIIKTSLGPTAIPGFDIAVSQQPSENLRATPAGAVIAHLAAGFALDRIGEQDRWVHVRRSGWVKSTALNAIAPATQPAGPARDLPARAPDTTP